MKKILSNICAKPEVGIFGEVGTQETFDSRDILRCVKFSERQLSSLISSKSFEEYCGQLDVLTAYLGHFPNALLGIEPDFLVANAFVAGATLVRSDEDFYLFIGKHLKLVEQGPSAIRDLLAMPSLRDGFHWLLSFQLSFEVRSCIFKFMNAVIVDTSPQVLRPTQDSRSVLFHNAKFAEAPLFSEFLMAVCIAEPDVRNKIELLDIMRSIYSGSMPRAIDYCTPKFREVLRACGRADINCTFEAIKDCVQSLLETVNGHPVSRTLFDDSELRSYLTFSYRQAVAFLSLGVNVSSIYCLKSQMQSMTCLLGRSRYLADALIKDGLLADTLHCLCAHLRLVSLVEDATSMPPFSEILSSFLSCFGLELVEMMPNQTLLNPGPTALLGGKE